MPYSDLKPGDEGYDPHYDRRYHGLAGPVEWRESPNRRLTPDQLAAIADATELQAVMTPKERRDILDPGKRGAAMRNARARRDRTSGTGGTGAPR